jgi:hypothetical protein
MSATNSWAILLHGGIVNVSLRGGINKIEIDVPGCSCSFIGEDNPFRIKLKSKGIRPGINAPVISNYAVIDAVSCLGSFGDLVAEKLLKRPVIGPVSRNREGNCYPVSFTKNYPSACFVHSFNRIPFEPLPKRLC